MSVHRVEMSAGTLAYEDEGSGGSAPVVLIHGWMATRSVWNWLRPHLPGQRLLLPDLRGAGSSGPGTGGYSLDLLAADIVQILDVAAPGRFHLVGHSMGGQVAQRVAELAPGRVQTLMLLNPVPLAGLPLPPDVSAAFRGAGGRRDALGGILDAACKLLAAGDREVLIEAAASIDAEIIAAGFDAWTQGLPGSSALGIEAPTRVVATDDPFLPVELLTDAVVKRIPGADLVRIAGPGHYPQVEAPAATAAALRAFWNA